MSVIPKKEKCVHCLHLLTRHKIPYYCGNYWYCSRHCYEEEMANPHVSHLLNPTHKDHDPHARDKHPPKDLEKLAHHKAALDHALHHKSALTLHAVFDDRDAEQHHHNHPLQKRAYHATPFGQGIIQGRYESSTFDHR